MTAQIDLRIGEHSAIEAKRHTENNRAEWQREGPDHRFEERTHFCIIEPQDAKRGWRNGAQEAEIDLHTP
jgi:hypothetical protein